VDVTVEEFFGARSGRGVGDQGQVIDLVTNQVGSLSVPSGVLGAVDPFAALDSPLKVEVKPGTYPVILTLGTYQEDDDPEFPDVAYLSLVLADGEPANVEPVPGTLVDGALYGVTTWGGGVGFVDALAAVGHLLPAGSAVLQNWGAMAGQHPHGVLDAPLPWAAHGENVIGVVSPNDQGQYPLYLTRDTSGKPLAVHIDFLVVGEGRYLLDVREWPPSNEVKRTGLKSAPMNRWP